jgi:hypothetical protein
VVSEPADQRATRIHQALHLQFGCERYRLSKYSPGPVADTEILNLIITDPQSLDLRSGKLNPVLAKQVHKNGLSVLRDAAGNVEFERTYAELKRSSDAKGKERFFHGVCAFETRRLRYQDDGARISGIYDTGLSDRPHHADIMAPPAGTRREEEQRLKKIIDKIGPRFVGVAAFRNGAFLRFSRP